MNWKFSKKIKRIISIQNYHYEYISVKLDSNLKNGSKYCLKLAAIRYDQYDYAFDRIEIAFSSKKIINLSKNDVIDAQKPIVLSKKDTLFNASASARYCSKRLLSAASLLG